MIRFPLPMFLRVFGAMVLMVILGSTTFGRLLGAYQDRMSSDTFAPIWSSAIRVALAPGNAPADGGKVIRHDLSVPLVLRIGEPPAHAYDMGGDGRSIALFEALRRAGVDVRRMRLDGRSDPVVTWLQVRPDGADSAGLRWVGLEGGVQPGDFRSRLWKALGALVLWVVVTAWFVSRWVALPLARLSRQVDDIAAGQVPAQVVRGAREIEHLGRALTAMARQRAAFDDQRRTMLIGVSHDLRSPLTRIRVAADLLEAPGTGRLRELIVRNVEQADAIIASFADYVRIDAEALTERVDLVAVVRASGEAAGLHADQITVDAASAPVRGHPLLLRRVLDNLVDNALRHGAPPVSMHLATPPGERLAVVTVSDDGAGITDPERMSRPFERGDAARHKPGSGLGLAIVARIVERHQGRLSIERGASGGARITVRLPLWTESVAAR